MNIYLSFTQGTLLSSVVDEAFELKHLEFLSGKNYNNQNEQLQTYALVTPEPQATEHLGYFEWSSAGNAKLNTLA